AAIAAAPLSVLWLAGRGKWEELNQARPRLRPTTRQITRGRPGPPGVWTGLEGVSRLIYGDQEAGSGDIRPSDKTPLAFGSGHGPGTNHNQPLKSVAVREL